MLAFFSVGCCDRCWVFSVVCAACGFGGALVFSACGHFCFFWMVRTGGGACIVLGLRILVSVFVNCWVLQFLVCFGRLFL